MPTLTEIAPAPSKITLGRYVQITRAATAATTAVSTTRGKLQRIDLLPWHEGMTIAELIRDLTRARRAAPGGDDPALAALQAAIDPTPATPFDPAAAAQWLDWPATPRRTQIWQALMRVPFGRTLSYAELAQKVLPPSGARAVGQTMNQNPFPLIVPCHRVIQAGGGLGGFGAGLNWKRALLAWEAAAAAGNVAGKTRR